MKNKGFIIAIICLCATILVSTIIIAVVVTSNTNSTNEYIVRTIEKQEAKQKFTTKRLTNEKIFWIRYGMTAAEVKEFIREQLKLTLDNSNLMKWNVGDYLDTELIKLNDVEGLTIWRNVVPSTNKKPNMYVSHSKLVQDPIEVMIYVNEDEDGTIDFIVCHKVSSLVGEHIIFEMDEDGWYADRMAKVSNGILKE